MSEALEITTFRLVSGLTGVDFVSANEDINDYLRRQPGFRWRRIGRRWGQALHLTFFPWDCVKCKACPIVMTPSLLE